MVALAASVACAIHCLATVLLLPLLPAALAGVAGTPAVEWGLWSLSALSNGWSMRRAGPRRRMLWLIGTAAGVVGLAVDREPLIRVSLVCFVLAALATAWTERRARPCAPACCGSSKYVGRRSPSES
jgi:hypothetical protein